MRFRLDNFDWEALRVNKKVKIYLGLAVVVIVFFAFCLDIIYSVYRYKYYIEKKPAKVVIKKKIKLPKKTVFRAGKIRVAIILDDAGGSIPNYRSILMIKQPLTISVLPHLSTSSSTAKAFRDAGYEVMLHLPMEPEDASYVRYDSGMVVCSYSDEEIKKTVEEDIEMVKYAKGLNNHLGSKATKEDRIMRAVLSDLKGKKLFFIDSKTSSDSLAMKIARQMHIPTAENNIFLDGGTKEAEIEGRFRDLISMAQAKGSAIGIGHATRPSTINVLRRMMPIFSRNGIKFVHASELVK